MAAKFANSWATKREIAVSVVCVMYGSALDEDKQGLWFKADKFRGNRADGRSGKRRDKSAFHPAADDMLHKIRDVMRRPLWHPDCRWFVFIVEALTIGLSGSTFEQSYNGASKLCWSVGETAFFERAIRPIIEHRFGRGPEPKFKLPDFSR